MKISSILLVLLLSTSFLFAQKSDFIIIRKHNLPVKTFFAGSYVTFRTSWGEWLNSRVDEIRDDSLFFREVHIRSVATIGGGSRLDTMTTYKRKIYYKDIVAIPRQKEGFAFIKNGVLAMIIGGGYIALNFINGTYINESPVSKENRQGLMTATTAFAAGFLLHKMYTPDVSIGKKYKVHYIKVRS